MESTTREATILSADVAVKFHFTRLRKSAQAAAMGTVQSSGKNKAELLKCERLWLVISEMLRKL